MECRSPTKHVFIEGNPSEKLSVEVRPSLADDPLVVGPRYQPNDLLCSWSNYLGTYSSGVLSTMKKCVYKPDIFKICIFQF